MRAVLHFRSLSIIALVIAVIWLSYLEYIPLSLNNFILDSQDGEDYEGGKPSWVTRVEDCQGDESFPHRENATRLLHAVANIRFYLISEVMQQYNNRCNIIPDSDADNDNSKGWTWPRIKSPGEADGELVFSSLLRRSPFRTLDPNKADLFILPIWPTCLGDHAATVSDWFPTTPFWQTHLRNHPERLLMFEQTTFNMRFMGSLWSQATILHYEVVRTGDSPGMPAFAGSALAGKDIAVPYWSSVSFLYGISDELLLHGERRYTFLSHSSQWNNAGNQLRTHIKELFTDSNSGMAHLLAPKFGDHLDHVLYAERLTESVFCIVSRGHTVTTRTLWNAIAAGCIPIVVSDLWYLPFEKQLPWEHIAIFLPEMVTLWSGGEGEPKPTDEEKARHKSALQTELRRLVDDVELQHYMRANVIKYRRRFFFGLGRPDNFDADWANFPAPMEHGQDRALAPDTFWSEGSLLIPSILYEAVTASCYPKPVGPTPPKTLDSLRQQIDMLKQVSRAGGDAQRQQQQRPVYLPNCQEYIEPAKPDGEPAKQGTEPAKQDSEPVNQDAGHKETKSIQRKHKVLVFMPVSDRSLHEINQWHLRDVRKFDLIMNYFGEDEALRERYEQHCDQLVRYRKVNKFQALVKLLEIQPDLFDGYDYLWMPDDDLKISITAVNEMLEHATGLRYAISQPAVICCNSSHYQLLVNTNNPEDAKTPFVEVMMPLFRHDVLVEYIIPFLKEHMAYKSGWGFDVWWSSRKYVPFDKWILHRWPVDHIKRINLSEGIYKALEMSPQEPFNELSSIMGKYGLGQVIDNANA